MLDAPVFAFKAITWEKPVVLAGAAHTGPVSRMLIEELWPLSVTHEWAAELGLALAGRYPRWWQQAPDEVKGLRLRQAQGFAFLRWLEQRGQQEVLVEELEDLLQIGPSCWRRDLEATAAQMRMPRLAPARLPEPPELDGEGVLLFADPFTLAYPGYGDLERWTASAFRGGRVEQRLPALAGNDLFERVHEPRYVRELFAWGRSGGGWLTPETQMTAETERALRASTGATVAALEAALGGELRTVFSFARPGSHHAESNRAGGTCLTNHLAVAASLVEGRVAILDVDAHHGNGTEEIFASSDEVLTVSIHQAQPFFPGTGEGGAEARANLNLPVASGESWRAAAAQAIEKIERHKPDAVLVELSTDAHAADPVSALRAADADFAFVAGALRDMNVPVVYELGASMSERAWIGGLRSVVKAR